MRRLARRDKAVVTLAVIALAMIVLAFTPRRATALDGTTGPIAVTVTPRADGRTVAIHAQAPAGTVIYEIKAHLCAGSTRVRDTFEFGFQGTACPNIALGHGDVERVAAFGAGAASGDLAFAVGEGSAHWVNELGYDQTIQCGVGHPCEVVAEIQITHGTVFFTAPVCYGGNCPAAPGTGGRLVPPVVLSATTAGAAPAANEAPHASAATASPSTLHDAHRRAGVAQGALRVPKSAGSAARRSAAPAARPLVAASSARSSLQLWLAAGAGAIAGAWILAVAMRRDALVLSAIGPIRRRRRARMATVR